MGTILLNASLEQLLLFDHSSSLPSHFFFGLFLLFKHLLLMKVIVFVCPYKRVFLQHTLLFIVKSFQILENFRCGLLRKNGPRILFFLSVLYFCWRRLHVNRGGHLLNSKVGVFIRIDTLEIFALINGSLRNDLLCWNLFDNVLIFSRFNRNISRLIQSLQWSDAVAR